jgi:aminomethyltransferase
VSLHDTLRDAGGVLEEVGGVWTPRRFGDVAAEVRALREGAALSALPHVACLRVTGDAAHDVLDRVVPADLFVRDGQIRHTLLLREDGAPLVDLYLCGDDDGFLLLAEGMPAADLRAHVRAHAPAGAAVDIVDLGETHTMLSINGPFAWELLAAVEGPDVIGLPYLTFYRPDPDRVTFRAGKTGEFGYDLLVPHTGAEALWERLVLAGRRLDLALAGTDALWHCQLENWFFNIHREGRSGLTPIELQLQWRVSPTKDYVGAAALRERRRSGAAHRITALQAKGPILAGDELVFEGEPIGRVLHAEPSITIGDRHVGIGLLRAEYAHSGIDRYAAARGGPGIDGQQGRTIKERALEPVRTVSAPFVNNRSLHVNPQKHVYAIRSEIPFPGAARHP